KITKFEVPLKRDRHSIPIPSGVEGPGERSSACADPAGGRRPRLRSRGRATAKRLIHAPTTNAWSWHVNFYPRLAAEQAQRIFLASLIIFLLVCSSSLK